MICGDYTTIADSLTRELMVIFIESAEVRESINLNERELASAVDHVVADARVNFA